MNTGIRVGVFWRFALFLLISARLGAAATYYNWQEYDGNGLGLGVIGNGTLQMSNNTTTVRANLIKGPGTFVDSLVIFVDSVPGGLTTTAQLNNKANAMEIAISGYKISRSVATFAPGFGADYAIVLGINSGSAIYRILDNSGSPYIEQVRPMTTGPMDNGSLPSYYFQFDWTDIGLPVANTNFFKFESTYITANGYRNLDSFEGVTGKNGYDFITFTNYDTYGVEPIPENTNAALAVFGGIVVSASLLHRIRRRPGSAGLAPACFSCLGNKTQ
jgi:hypothetical protein